MIRTLRLKFICVTMAIVTVLLGVIFGLVIHTTAVDLEEQSIEFLRHAADGPDRPGPQGGPPSKLQLPCFIVRVTPRGQSVERSDSFDLSDEQMLTDIISEAKVSETEVGELTEYSLRFCRLERPTGLTLIFADISTEKATLRDLQLNCIAIGTLSLLVFWGISILLARWAVRPVERAWAEQRQFVADASHELKTPLTVIMTNAELLQSDPGQEQYARSILTMSQRMRALVEGLLELARVDNGAVRAVFTEVDLSALVEEELLPFEPLYFERALTLSSELEPGLRVSGSDRHLRQVLSILLDNAMHYSLPGSQVRVRLVRQGGSALLTVTNPGGPLSPEECRSIFRRFYRIDKARSGGGYGLGLPIAQGIVTDHGGRIWAESREELVTLSVQLPLKREP